MNILIVEDDDVAAESVVRSLRRHAMEFPVTIAHDGLEALAILRGEAPIKISKPFIILLDLNMSRMNGFEFLREIRSDVKLRDSIIFVLTTSNADSDRTLAYKENIAGYLVKSAVGPQFTHLANLLDSYSNAVTLPGNHR